MTDIFTFVSIGFNISCSLFFLLRYFSTKATYYIFIALVGIMQCLYMAFSHQDILSLVGDRYHTNFFQISSIGLSSVVLFFFLFLVNFLDLKEQKWIRRVFYIGIIYMSLGIFAKALRHLFEWAANTSKNFFIKYYIVIDVFVMLSLLIYILKVRKKYTIYLLFAIIGLIISGLFIHIRDYFGIDISKYHLRQIEVMVGNIFFFMAIFEKEKEADRENQKIKESLFLAEVNRQKDVLEERNRIARDMHDDLGAGLSAIKLQLELVNRKLEKGNTVEGDINDLLSSAEGLHLSMREMLWNLNATQLDTQSFSNYAANYSKKFLEKGNVHIYIHKQLDDSSIFFSPEKSRHLLMCLKEALNNIVKHSKADTVELSFIQNDKSFEIHLQDNGIGFSNTDTGGMGLKNIRNRMQNINGSATWTHNANGCLLILSI